jgi:ketosteroid isomerase-like protein
MSAEDLELAEQFLSALANAAETGDRDALYRFLDTDVTWLTPQRDLRGIEEVRNELTWVARHDNLDVEFEQALTDLGDGAVVTDVHETYRIKKTGDFAYTRDRRIELTIRDGKVARYEMRVVG